jgi:chromatin segregation and condensation protein Rec8/ScpA/Scc1 (kleisin family)
VTDLCAAVRRIIAYREEKPRAEKVTFTPMISSPIVPVEAKIIGILRHFETEDRLSLSSLLDDSVSLPDLIAIFLGVLELIKVRRLRILEDPEATETVLGEDTVFVQGDGNEHDIAFDDFDTPSDTEPHYIAEQEESVHE